jgi:catechol 2,3-dioxygenase-like lactoylglutathione lyase family enzyme
VYMKLEAVVLPVSDVDRAKAFYQSLGFVEDFDYAAGERFRVVRFTPPGSSTALVFGTGITAAPPGSVCGLVLGVGDIEAARSELIARGIDVTDVFHDMGGVFYHESPLWEVPGRDPAGRDHASFARFADPDGNGWVLEEVRSAAGTGGNGHGD